MEIRNIVRGETVSFAASARLAGKKEADAAQTAGTSPADRVELSNQWVEQMQEQMQEADKELEELEVVGLSGGGEEGDETVVVYMNGKKIINGVEFGSKLSEIIDITDEDDVEMLEDLIMAAINDGYKKADALYEEKMGPFAKAGKGLL